MNKIFITGASSGIGKSLAFAYAKRKCIIGLSARRISLLNEVYNKCIALGGFPYVYELDVQNSENCRLVSRQFIKDANGVDCVIANAGIGGVDDLFSGSSYHINNIIKTNLIGVTNTLMPFIPEMRTKNKGFLVCISSVASFFPLPLHGGYSSSKRAIRMIFDSWRPMLKNYNIKTICICPGFIDTAMVSRKTGILPLRSPIDAAEKFLVAIKKGKINYVYPWQYYILILIANIIPKWLYDFIIKKMFPKPITKKIE